MPASVVQNPVALFSSDGVLNVRFSYQHRIDSSGRELFCFMTPDGLQNPTLHVNPGDHLIITVTNNTPVGTGGMTVNPPNCGDTTMNSSSVNIHYHGTNTSPKCHQDEVIKTLVNSGQTFQYNVSFPLNEPLTAVPSTRYRAAPPGRSLWTASTMCSRPSAACAIAFCWSAIRKCRETQAQPVTSLRGTSP
jgi:hypothetical protein